MRAVPEGPGSNRHPELLGKVFHPVCLKAAEDPEDLMQMFATCRV